LAVPKPDIASQTKSPLITADFDQFIAAAMAPLSHTRGED
jgi:hypothetical protein